MPAKAKSAQPDSLDAIYDQIEALLKSYMPPLVPLNPGKIGTKRGMAMGAKKRVVIFGRERDEVWFAAAIGQKGYVGFYYMPINAEPTVRAKLSPRLLKLLKGKGCFHVKVLDAELVKDIKDALEIGFKAYKKNGWL